MTERNPADTEKEREREIESKRAGAGGRGRWHCGKKSATKLI